MTNPSYGMVDKAIVVLSNLDSVPDGKSSIVNECRILALVDILEIISQKGKEFSTTILLQLCEYSYLYQTLVS
jgi:hypothetical protein